MKITKKYLKKIIEKTIDEQFRTSIQADAIDSFTSEQVNLINKPEYQKSAKDILTLLKNLDSTPQGGFYSKVISYKGQDESLYAARKTVITDMEKYNYLLDVIKDSTHPMVTVNAEEELRYVPRKELNLIFIKGPRSRHLVTDYSDLDEVLLGLQEKEVDFMAAQAGKESVKENKIQKQLFEQKISGDKISSTLNPRIEAIVLKEIEKLLEEVEFTSDEEHFRAADDTEYADPTTKNRGRALTRDKPEKEAGLDDEFSSSEDKEQFFLRKIKDIYDHLETLAAAI